MAIITSTCLFLHGVWLNWIGCNAAGAIDRGESLVVDYWLVAVDLGEDRLTAWDVGADLPFRVPTYYRRFPPHVRTRLIPRVSSLLTIVLVAGHARVSTILGS